MKYLYTSPIPETAQTNEQTRLAEKLSKLGVIDGEDTVVSSVSSEAADVTIEGQYRWGERVSTILGTELDELADSGPSNIPFYRADADFPKAGYYVIEQADVEPLHANRRDVWQFEISLTVEGTRANHRREVETDGRELSQPWGSDPAAPVGIPAVATDVQWLDPAETTTQDATLAETHAGEIADVALYDPADASVSDPVIVYDLPYHEEGSTDVRVWDSRGHASKTDANGIIQWQKVHSAAHDFGDTAGDEAVIDNGCHRLHLDPASDPGVALEEWDDAASSWTSVSLPTSGDAGEWSLESFDIAERVYQRLHAARVDVRTTWRKSSGERALLDMTTHRGWARPQVARVPDASTAVPPGLVDLLDPIASAYTVHPQPVRGLRPREEIE